ncbi:MAG: isoprenylcysteine carboxylmethyltransferase family protein [Chloroflexi bacterium]|nr:isoprenylcysteine carboxylmethyltransferase family protein [Chloroflexota bacterium]
MEKGLNAQEQTALSKSTIRKAVAGLVVITAFPAAIMFLAAGRLDWWEAWLMIGVLAISTIMSRVIMLRKYPELAMERARWTENRNTKAWDKQLMPIVALYGPALMWLVAGLDKRLSASPPLAVELEIAAFALVILGYLFSIWAFLENKFFSAVVRIQTERGHTVVNTGPYRWVRHPGYAGGIVGYLITPIALGTLWVFLPAVLTGIAVIARTALEDQTLQNELAGYREYAARVRYRLLPGVW